MGRISPDRPRPLLVKFHSRGTRDLIYENRGKLRDKGIDVFIGEDLDPVINTLAFSARKLVREQIFHHTWIEKGVVKLVRREGLAPVEVPNLTELQKMANEEREGPTY